MKRILFSLVLAGFAVTLAGCPADKKPVTPATPPPADAPHDTK